MTSFIDLERTRTDYFDGALGDVLEPSSSPSEGSPSPLRALAEDPISGLAGSPAFASSSHTTDRDPVFNEHDGFHHSRKGHRSHVRDSTSSSKKLSSLLVLTSERLDKEIRRANDAERRALEAITLARSENEAKLIAQRDATRANEELRMYKLQYENAQREIFKAQELIDQIEAERQDAEAAAARARSTARKLKEQNLIIMAREEGRQLGYQEGLATGRRMAYERMEADDYTEDFASGDEVILSEHPSNIRLRSPTPGAGSRPSSRPPAARQPPPPPPPPMRPPSRSAHANFESVPHHSTLATPINPQQPTRVGPQPPPIHLEATPPPRNRARSKSDPLGYPPDNWIPTADEKSHIAMPPPHHMSPSPSPVAMEPVRIPNPAPVPPPPIVTEEATVETSTTTSETSSETIPPQTVVRPKDYAYHASKLRERDERQPQRSRTPTLLSPGSTRMSDYGILSSPQADQRRVRAPVQVHHFEIERGDTPTREKMNRSWSMRKKKESVSSSPVRIDVSSAPVPPPPVTEDVIVAPRPRKPGKSPLSRMSPSSSSSSSTSTAKDSTSSTSSTDRTKLDPRKDLGSGGGSRTPLSWLFRKRMKEHSGEKGSTSDNSVDITVESPSESNHSMSQNVPPEGLPQPTLLSPDYRFTVLPPEPPVTTRGRDREPSTPTPKPTGENRNLPPLAEFTNLISPGQGNVATGDLPPGFVPNPPLTDQVQQGGSGGGGQPPRRSASTRSKRRDKEPTYEAAPLTPGVHYPTPPPGADIPRSKSRASRSSRQGQVPGALGTP